MGDESLSYELLKQINRKLDALLESLSDTRPNANGGERLDSGAPAKRLRDRAVRISALTPTGVTQTDAVELLRQDRVR
jgi:hypothetical protein